MKAQPVKNKKSPYRIQVLDRALAILDVLGSQRSESSLAQLSTTVELHKSTTHRLMIVLERHRLVAKNPETGRYRLGLKLFELGSKAIAGKDLQQHAFPHLHRLVDETQETVHLCILDEGEMLYLQKIEPQRTVRMASSIGRRAPAHSTAVGKAILAELPEREVDEMILKRGLKSLTPNTITRADKLKAELRATHTRGYAVDNEENEEGVRCVGAAVWDHSGRPVAAISVSGPSFRISKEIAPVVARAVVKTAQELSRELGLPSVRGNASRGRKRA